MNVTRENPTPTSIKLTITAAQSELDVLKQIVLTNLSRNVKVQGFRPGKAPQHLVEKQLDQSLLQTEFLEQAVNQLYVKAIQEQKVRPVAQPEINITKFVPFTLLEFTAQLDAIGDIKLTDYKKVKLAKTPVKVTAADVTGVLDNLLERGAEKKAVTRAAKLGDEAIIDFAGVDAKTKEPIAGADGKAYPLQLGSKTFIPGFEEEVVGLKPGAEKTFLITFPADYSVADLQKRKVSFTITVQTLNELVKPKLDDAFAASIGPFKSVDELKTDIKKQLQIERDQDQQRQYDNDLLEKIAEKSDVEIPASLVEEEVERMEEEEKRNVAYRGQTWQQHLDEEGLTADAHKDKNRPAAALRIKAGLLLGAIADKENIEVTPEELEMRMQLLKGQYTDASMQAELEKPESRRDISSRMLTEKTLDKLRSYATAK